MSSRKLSELASDVDDAAMVLDELQADSEGESSEKFDELRATLEQASDTIDELHDEKTDE